jgi:hypothetical protein
MRSEMTRRQKMLLALAVFAVISCLAGDSVVWQYEGNSSSSSGSQQIPQSPSSEAFASNNGSNDDSNSNSFAASSGSSSAAAQTASGSLWGWGGAPRGFSANNGTLEYPDDYYTSHFNLGYGDSGIAYGQTKLNNLSHYATGFSTGCYAGNSIYGLIADSNSSYDPWNNYHGYDPNYPYGYPSS